MGTHNDNNAAKELQQIQLGSKIARAGRPCCVVAEIGINHNGDIDIAKKLINHRRRRGLRCSFHQLDGKFSVEPWGNDAEALKPSSVSDKAAVRTGTSLAVTGLPQLVPCKLAATSRCL